MDNRTIRNALTLENKQLSESEYFDRRYWIKQKTDCFLKLKNNNNDYSLEQCFHLVRGYLMAKEHLVKYGQ